MERSKNRPVQQFKAGAISVTIWNNSDNKDGHQVSYNTINLQRSYKDGNDWKHTSSLRLNDLPKAALLLNKAYEFLVAADSGKTESAQEQVKQRGPISS